MSGRKSYDELKFDLYYANELLKEMRKELINNDEYIAKLRKKYDKEIERLNNIINKAIEILDIYGTSNYETADLLYSTLRGSDKE